MLEFRVLFVVFSVFLTVIITSFMPVHIQIQYCARISHGGLKANDTAVVTYCNTTVYTIHHCNHTVDSGHCHK